jgi:uncharacterized protein (TIGR03118 family)
MQLSLPPRLARRLAIAISLTFGAGAAAAQHYNQVNLVSNQTGQATNKDLNLVNAWGIARSSTSPWWVSDNGTGKATIYNGTTGVAGSLVVAVPGAPTGMVFNGTPGFSILGGAPARFLFASEDGTISAWNGGTAAQVVITTVGAVYKGIAIATVDGNPRLYATDFHNGHVDVFDANFQPVSSGKGNDKGNDKGKGDDQGDDHGFFSGKPRGFAPFNIQNLGGTFFVAFAKQDAAKHDEVDGPGLGLIGAFTPGGKLIQWFDHVNDLNAPWGMAMAPSEFGTFSHHLLVGQFGSGEILAFNLESGEYAGKLLQPGGQPVRIDGLWGIGFGAGNTNSGPLTTLFFAAGPNGESNGLFGTLTALPADLIQGNSN